MFLITFLQLVEFQKGGQGQCGQVGHGQVGQGGLGGPGSPVGPYGPVGPVNIITATGHWRPGEIRDQAPNIGFYI